MMLDLRLTRVTLDDATHATRYNAVCAFVGNPDELGGMFADPLRLGREDLIATLFC